MGKFQPESKIDKNIFFNIIDIKESNFLHDIIGEGYSPSNVKQEYNLNIDEKESNDELELSEMPTEFKEGSVIKFEDFTAEDYINAIKDLLCNISNIRKEGLNNQEQGEEKETETIKKMIKYLEIVQSKYETCSQNLKNSKANIENKVIQERFLMNKISDLQNKIAEIEYEKETFQNKNSDSGNFQKQKRKMKLSNLIKNWNF